MALAVDMAFGWKRMLGSNTNIDVTCLSISRRTKCRPRLPSTSASSTCWSILQAHIHTHSRRFPSILVLVLCIAQAHHLISIYSSSSNSNSITSLPHRSLPRQDRPLCVGGLPTYRQKSHVCCRTYSLIQLMLSRSNAQHITCRIFCLMEKRKNWTTRKTS